MRADGGLLKATAGVWKLLSQALPGVIGSLLSTLLLSAFGTALIYVSVYVNWRQGLVRMRNLLFRWRKQRHEEPTREQQLFQSFAKRFSRDASPDGFVSRPAVESALARYLDHGIGHYLVVTGPSGSGKSSEVRAALEGRQGVISLVAGDTLRLKPVYTALLRLSGQPDDVEEDLVRLLRTAPRTLTDDEDEAEAPKGDPQRSREDWLPCVLVDLPAGTPVATLRAAARLAKRVAVDERVARCVLVLRETALMPDLPWDDDLGSLLWVGDLKMEQARILLDARECLVPGSKEEAGMLRERVLSTVGLRPRCLQRVCDAVEEARPEPAEAVLALLADREAAARAAVSNLLASSQDHYEYTVGVAALRFERLFRDLVRSPTHTVSAVDAHYMCAPDTVVELLARREHGALVYNPASREYAFSTPAHLRAAEEALAARPWRDYEDDHLRPDT